MLKRAANHEIERNILLSALELEFLPQEAEDQIDILMNWGRYAEIFVYDDQSESIFLEN